MDPRSDTACLLWVLLIWRGLGLLGSRLLLPKQQLLPQRRRAVPRAARLRPHPRRLPLLRPVGVLLRGGRSAAEMGSRGARRVLARISARIRTIGIRSVFDWGMSWDGWELRWVQVIPSTF